MTGLDDIKALYAAYMEEADKAERERKPWDGAFGMGKKASDDPCHTRFAENLDSLLLKAADEKPESGHIRKMLDFIYSAPDEGTQPRSVYWMLIAVHGLTAKLIYQLAPGDAAELCSRYEAKYPRRERLPVQKKVLAALKQTRK